MIKMKQLSVFIKEKMLLSSVSMVVPEGSFFCLIGESGGGKTLISKGIMNLLPPNLEKSGSVELGSQKIDMILQDPRGSLQTVISIKKQLEDLLRSSHNLNSADRTKLIKETLSEVGLENTEELMKKYPYQLSGGMCQKVAIAAALLLNPSILVADEPTSALDVKSQESILELLQRIRETRGLTIFLVTHDLTIVKKFATHVGVVKEGSLIEIGKKVEVLKHPKQTYTKELIGIFERYDSMFNGSKSNEEN